MEFGEERRLVALACRVLAHAGLAEDVLGHVSLRIGADRMLVRCRGPQESGLLFTTPEDVRPVPLDGPYDRLPDGYAVPAELPIHTETLRRRPEATVVVHAHPPALVAADLARLPLRPIFGAYNIPAMRLALEGIPVYERGVLIRTTDLAGDMLAAMGDRPVCALRGHGVTVTGATVAQAVVRTLNVEALARMTLQASRPGGAPRSLPDEDVAELPDLGAELNEESIWRYRLARLEASGLGLPGSGASTPGPSGTGRSGYGRLEETR
ncbi:MULTISPECIES: class II aldolase/adducin family protein [Thermomonosporaceae]|uniref:class II aldolase/adducin family protein n=1 Tax=Thermomonosporaceae TaxID=2012 RepID=UPI00255ABFE8|nr:MULTISPECIES: class II aldolase/adducin family protein [Thermomonosporaceae]MDL4773154.1 class II aldolase/adducin family protein [Actinomadura xylanilytica]